MAMGCANWGQLAYVLIFKCCKNGQVSTMNRAFQFYYASWNCACLLLFGVEESLKEY